MELKPCPFCGGKAVLYGDAHSAFIECDYCGMFNGKHISLTGEAEADAIKAWNKRHNEPPVVDEVPPLDNQRRESDLNPFNRKYTLMNPDEWRRLYYGSFDNEPSSD